jgi:hypothetical protein
MNFIHSEASQFLSALLSEGRTTLSWNVAEAVGGPRVFSASVERLDGEARTILGQVLLPICRRHFA